MSPKIRHLFNSRAATIALALIGPMGLIFLIWFYAKNPKASEVVAGKEVSVSEFRRSLVPNRALAFSGDGGMLAVAGYDEVVLWDLRQGRLHARLAERHFTGPVQAVVFSRSGMIAAAGGQSGSPATVLVIDSRSQRVLHEFKGPREEVSALAVNPSNDVMAAASLDGRVYLWDMATGAVVKALREHHGRVAAAAFSADGKWLATGGEDRDVILWNVATWEIAARRPQGGAVDFVRFGPDNTNLLWSVSGETERSLFYGRVLPESEEEVSARRRKSPPARRIQLDRMAAASVALGGNGRVVFLGDDTGRIHPVKDFRKGVAVEGHRDWVHSMAISPDGRLLASGGADGAVRLWHAADLKPIATMVQPIARADDFVILAANGSYNANRIDALAWIPGATDGAEKNSSGVRAALAGFFGVE